MRFAHKDKEGRAAHFLFVLLSRVHTPVGDK